MSLYDSNTPTSDIMMQVFYWDTQIEDPGKWYTYLQTKLSDISTAKISLLWMPPSSKSYVRNYVGYTPMDYYDVGEYQQWIEKWNRRTSTYEWEQHDGKATLYGTRAELTAFITACKSVGIKCLADIVVNHRAAQQHNEDDELLRWKGNVHTIASGKMAWGEGTNDPPEVTFKSGGGRYRDDGENGFGINLAHENPDVRKEVKEWMEWLKNDIGFEGWRYDYVKGFEGKHLGEYNYHTRPYISVGEYFDGNVDLVDDWINTTDANDNKRSMAFDFPLYYHLRKVFSEGERPFNELANWLDRNTSLIGRRASKAVTFLDNHDTYRHDGDRFPPDDKKLVQGYAFLLTHPGIPCVFWNHVFERDTGYAYRKILALCKLRTDENITNQSRVEILARGGDLYAAKIDGRIIVNIGDRVWKPSDSGIPGNWSAILYGRGWAVWKE